MSACVEGELVCLVEACGKEKDLLSVPLTVVISCMLDLLLFLLSELSRMKYFWAWLATWVGVLDTTKFLEILLQSPLPYL